MTHTIHDHFYLDMYNNPAWLTEEELSFFNDTADHIKRILGVSIKIVPSNHEQVPGHEEALGLYHYNDENEFITIDNYFIHECYMAERCGGFAIEAQTLSDVICHEIAHRRYHRHTKYHAALTREYIEQVA